MFLWVWFQAELHLVVVLTLISLPVCLRRRDDVCGGGRVAAGGQRKHRGGPELPQWTAAAPEWAEPGPHTGNTHIEYTHQVHTFTIEEGRCRAPPPGCLWSPLALPLESNSPAVKDTRLMVGWGGGRRIFS